MRKKESPNVNAVWYRFCEWANMKCSAGNVATSVAWLLAVAQVCVHDVRGGPFNYLGPEIAAPELHRITPTSVSVDYASTPTHPRPVITLVGKRFTEEYGAGRLRCRRTAGFVQSMHAEVQSPEKVGGVRSAPEASGASGKVWSVPKASRT